MPRYLIERSLGAISADELDAAAERSSEVREQSYPQIVWEHTHVVSAPDGVKAFCVYEAPDTDTLRRHAADAGLPIDRMYEVAADLVP